MEPAVIGVGLAIGLAAFARLVGFDRDRAFYPVVLIIVGSYYVLFAVMAGATGELPELGFFALFAASAAVGFRTSLWIIVAGLALHGVFDFVRASMDPGSGVPGWWPAFCGTFDVAAAAILALLLTADQRKASAVRN